MKHILMERPFTQGMVTDLPAHAVGAKNSVLAQDGYSPSGIFIQRGGWEYDGTTADVADNLITVMRAQFILNDNTRTATGDDDGDFFIHNPAGAGTALFTGTVPYLFRCMYGDQAIFCAQDGLTPLRRWSGATTIGASTDLAGVLAVDEAVITGLGLNPVPDVGCYVNNTLGPGPVIRILKSAAASVTLEHIKMAAGGAAPTITISLTGTTFPAVSIYSAGTANATGANTVTGYGTGWNSDVSILTTAGTNDSWGTPNGFDSAEVFGITSVGSDTSLTTSATTISATKTEYDILRRCPFTDAANHKNSLWGTGVAQYPNRVYVSPPGWDMSAPPGFILPWVGFGHMESSNYNDFLLDNVDVPTPFDGDVNVALLPSPNHLWVLKREKAYGIYGSFGGLDVSRDPIGPGCIDIRSAIATSEGSFWASEDDVYWAPGQQAIPLMSGKISREWRALTNSFDFGTSDYVSCGVAAGYLFVHITTAAGTTQRTYCCELNGAEPRSSAWQSRTSNVTPRCMFSSRVPGEAEKLLAVSDARQGRVLDLAPMVDGSGTAKDDAGTGPRLQATTSTALGRADGIEGVTRLVDLDIHTNVYDAGTAGSTVLDVSVISGGGVGNPANATKTLTAINSDTVDRIDRHHRRVARDGRFHQASFAVSTLGTDTTATKVEIHQIDAFVRDGRPRSR